jgi:hypothetical protein
LGGDPLERPGRLVREEVLVDLAGRAMQAHPLGAELKA